MAKKTDAEVRVQKRRDMIKNILIVFLVVMLLLTFFSGTIQNWSLPEVSTNRVEAATISPMVRGNGVVESDDPYNIIISQSRKISGVAVKVGDEVKKDDPIYHLEEADSKELDEAVAALRKMETEYNLALFDEKVTDSAIARARSGNIDSIDSYQAQRKNMNDRLLAATEADEAATARIASLEEQHKQILAALGEADTSAQKHAAADLTAEQTILKNQQSIMSSQLQTMDKNDPMYAYYYYTISGIDNQLALINIQGAEVTREASHITTEKEKQIADEKKRYETALEALNEEKLQTAAALAEVKEELDEFYASARAEISLSASQENIADARRAVEKLREDSVGSAVRSPVDGIVMSLAYVAGQTIEANKTCAVIQIADKPMTVQFSVTNDQAKLLKVGDEAEPQNSWQYTQFRSHLTAIKPDKDDPGNKKQLTFSIESPEVSTGQSVSLQIGQTSRTYEMTVPNSAIREDNNGKFILIIEERPSPLRNRYIARRADVEVTTSDDTKSAINAAIEGWEYVITTSTVPIKAGQEVRLANSGS